MKKPVRLFCLITVLLAGCSAPQQTPTLTPVPQKTLNLKILYPTPSSQLEMGQITKAIVQVMDEEGHPVKDASVTLTFSDPNGKETGTVSATFGDGDLYRTKSWTVPHKMQAGRWIVKIVAVAVNAKGQIESDFPVKYSTSEELYHKYGFWLDAPTLRGIQPTIAAERGDGENGMVRWGGTIPSQHVFPENWVEVHWRKGDFGLESPKAVRKFMLAGIGDFGFTPVREIAEFKRIKFKQWDAWEAQAQGQLHYYDMKWVVFYAPEVEKTYALATTVVQPPSGIDAHEVLLENFDIDPSIPVDGVAPEHLLSLLPQPELVSPEIGATFTGLEQPILLRWEPLKELAEDEYYQVAVDYNYKETNFLVRYATKETQFALPEALYQQPNCSVFNWRVTLMQKTGVDKNGNTIGKALSYSSLYRFVIWLYPQNEAPFDPHCPNAQY